MISQMTGCPTCLGIGTVVPSTVCPTCNGKGTVDEFSQAQHRQGVATTLQKTVVTISRDEALQMTRTELSRRAGYSVVPLTP